MTTLLLAAASSLLLIGCTEPSPEIQNLTPQCNKGSVQACIKAGNYYTDSYLSSATEKMKMKMKGKATYHYSRACDLGNSWSCEYMAKQYEWTDHKEKYYHYLGQAVELNPGYYGKKYARKVAHGYGSDTIEYSNGNYYLGRKNTVRRKNTFENKELAKKYAKLGCDSGDRYSCYYYKHLTKEDRFKARQKEYRERQAKETKNEKKREAERIAGYKQGKVGFGLIAAARASCELDLEMGEVTNYQACVRSEIDRKRRAAIRKYENR